MALSFEYSCGLVFVRKRLSDFYASVGVCVTADVYSAQSGDDTRWGEEAMRVAVKKSVILRRDTGRGGLALRLVGK